MTTRKMENKKQIFSKISDFYSGEVNQDEVKNELGNNLQSKELFQWINLFWFKLNPKINHSDTIKRRTWQKIKDEHPLIFFLRLKSVKYAAVVLLALCIGSGVYFSSNKEIRMIIASSGIGQVKIVNLPDGSKAWLNAKSSLSYPEKFKGELREVKMDGEIYFEVTHDKKHPFIVHSKLIHIKVLGTSFMVSSYANEPVVDTYLEEGSIELDITELKKTMKLVPGDDVIYNKKTSVVTMEKNPHSVLDSWRFGKISFYNESLNGIARKLERKFGAVVQIGDENIGEMKLTADFESENLEQILNFLCEVAGVKYKESETGYLIMKK